MLELRPNCERCNKDLPPDSSEARICSFECTFCSACAAGVLNSKCPNCGGELLPRPRRPATKLPQNPPSADETAMADFHRIGQLVNGFWTTQILNVAVQLGIPEQLAQGPKTATSIAQAAQAHPSSVFRLLRALHTLGVCRAVGEESFELTTAGHVLRPDVSRSLRGRALFAGDMLWQQYSDLAYVVKSGNTTQKIDTGPDAFKKLSADPVRFDSFQRAMAEGSVRTARDAVAHYDFSRFSSVLDLGGGYGGVLSVLLATNQTMTGAVCDLAYLEEPASRYLQQSGVGERGKFVAGDFFESVPSAYAAYLLKFIIHDWDDEYSLKILRNIHRAATSGSTLILLEQPIPERLSTGPTDQAVIRADITMMTIGSRERTVEEYRQLLAQAGWTLTRVVQVSPELGLLEAQRA
jgi:orsellinic acid C2-O-methyltransferase